MDRHRARTWALRIGRDRDGDVWVLTVSGRVGAKSAAVLRDALVDASREALAVVLDLGSVDYISGAGVATVHEAAARLAEAGGALVLCALQDPVRIAFDLAGLEPVCSVETTRPLAVDAVRAARQP